MSASSERVDHHLSMFNQTRQTTQPGDAYRSYELTGKSLWVCNCGLDTGWVDSATLTREMYEQHLNTGGYGGGFKYIDVGSLEGLSEFSVGVLYRGVYLFHAPCHWCTKADVTKNLLDAVKEAFEHYWECKG